MHVLKKWGISGVFAGVALAVLAALIAWRVWRGVERRFERPVPILMYHHIGPVEDSPWWVPADVFERQLKSLREQGYTSILPADLAAHQRQGKRLPRRPVILTFDDGYLDSLTAAEPLLKKYGFRGMVYLITGAVGDAPDKRQQYEGSDCLVWPEVRAMRRRGVLSFGGHGHQHYNLAVAEDPFPTIMDCFKAIKKKAGFKPDSFCYPHGQYNEQVMDAVRRAGFTTAVVCEDAVATSGPEAKLLALPRVSVMGGRHRFAVARARDKEETPGEIVIRVTHVGVSLDIAPRLPGAPDGGWLPARELRHGSEVDWCWKLATSAVPAQISFELWDRNRIFRFYP